MKQQKTSLQFMNADMQWHLGFFLEVLHFWKSLNQLTIKPRSKGALGFAQYLPNETNLYSKEELLDQIIVILGGRCAELEFFGKETTGASDDLQRSRTIAFDIVTRYGMSEGFKYVSFTYDDQGNKMFSEKTHEVSS